MAIRFTSATLTATGQSASCPLNWKSDFPVATVHVTCGSATYSVEVTIDNVLDPTVTPVWVAATNGSGLTAAASLIKIDYPVQAVRLNVTAYTSGNVIMKVMQQ